MPKPAQTGKVAGLPYVTDFRTALAMELPQQGLIPVEHITSNGTVYLRYILPDDEELPYRHDPVCGDCGCLRTACLGIPDRGWDDLVPEGECLHRVHGKPAQDDSYSCRNTTQGTAP